MRVVLKLEVVTLLVKCGVLDKIVPDKCRKIEKGGKVSES